MNQMSDEQLNEIKEILHHSGDKVVMTKDLIIALNDFGEKLWNKMDQRFDKLEQRMTNLEIKFAKLENKQWYTLTMIGAIVAYISWKFIF